MSLSFWAHPFLTPYLSASPQELTLQIKFGGLVPEATTVLPKVAAAGKSAIIHATVECYHAPK